ncbi:MAG: MaoC family dehydratase [Nocardioidaceae bacterium]
MEHTFMTPSQTSWSATRCSVPKVGDSAERRRRVSSEDLELFAQISGDRNPLHFDADAAASSAFGETIVHGGITTAILNAVVAEDLPGPGSVFLGVEWRFERPVRPDDDIVGRVEVVSVREDKPICQLKTTVTRGDGTVALSGTATTYTSPLDHPSSTTVL